MLIFTYRLDSTVDPVVSLTLALNAEERVQSRLRCHSLDGQPIALQLPRGTVLVDGDLLGSPGHSDIVRIVANPEPVLIATAPTPLLLLRATYHLGNRHVPLEITSTYLKLAPDPVLEGMLHHLGLQVQKDLQPFQPEAGAYGLTSHTHAHDP